MKKKNYVIEKDLIFGEIYPPDYFLKKLKKTDAFKFAANLANPIKNPYKAEDFKSKLGKGLAVFDNVKDKVGIGIVSTVVPAKAIQANQLKKEAAAVDAKLLKSGGAQSELITKNTGDLMPKVDIVSGVAGIKGTPVINNTNQIANDMNLRDTIKSIGEKIPAPLRDALKDQGNQLIAQGTAKLTDSQRQIADLATNAALLPKTKGLKEAEALLTSPTRSDKTVLGASGFSMPSPIIIGVVLILVVVLFLKFKK